MKPAKGQLRKEAKENVDQVLRIIKESGPEWAKAALALLDEDDIEIVKNSDLPDASADIAVRIWYLWWLIDPHMRLRLRNCVRQYPGMRENVDHMYWLMVTILHELLHLYCEMLNDKKGLSP